MVAVDDPSRLTRQLALDLRTRTHGGARAEGDPVHVTLRMKERLPSLRAELLANIVKRALVDQREKLAAKGAKHFQVVHFSVHDDHIHLIIEAANKRGISRGVSGLEVRLSRRLNKALHRDGRLWTERYHRHDLRTPSETRNALRFARRPRVVGAAPR